MRINLGQMKINSFSPETIKSPIPQASVLDQISHPGNGFFIESTSIACTPPSTGFTLIGALGLTGRESLRKGGVVFFVCLHYILGGKFSIFYIWRWVGGNTLSVIFIPNLNTIPVWHYHAGHKGYYIS